MPGSVQTLSLCTADVLQLLTRWANYTKKIKTGTPAARRISALFLRHRSGGGVKAAAALLTA